MKANEFVWMPVMITLKENNTFLCNLHKIIFSLQMRQLN